MAYSDLLSELLGIDKLCVMRTEIESAEQITLFVESVEEVAVCPEYKQLSLQVHGLCDKQLIHDLSYGERRCYLSYQARRFRCNFCDKTFTEEIAWKRAGVSYTLRYEKHVYQRARFHCAGYLLHPSVFWNFRRKFRHQTILLFPPGWARFIL
jgi:transposase